MGCFFWGDDEWRECDDCPYFSKCPELDDNQDDNEDVET
jgi:hypothetical protein